MLAVVPQLLWDQGSFESERALLIEAGKVAGTCARSAIPREADTEEWGNVALMPGTVNAHGHSFQNLLKGFADDRSFDSWRDDVLYPFSDKLDADGIYAGALFAFSEALLAGITTTVDFFYLHDHGNDNAERVITAAHDAGIRLVFARTFYDIDAQTRAPSRYRESRDEAAARCLELARRHATDTMVSVQPAPHSL